MMTREYKIMHRLQEFYNYATTKYEVLGCFLTGSQNYGLDTEQSDIDCKIIVIPTLENIASGRPMVSVEHRHPETGEHADIKDVRLMFNMLKKQNINFVEMLYTKFYIVNPKYEQIWSQLLLNREEIAHYDKVAALNCMIGTVERLQEKTLLQTAYHIKWKEIGYDAKAYSNVVRLAYFVINYCADKPYEFCLRNTKYVRDQILEYRYKNFMTKEAIEQTVKEFLAMISAEKDEYLTVPENSVKNTKVEQYLNDASWEVFKIALGNK